MPPLATNQVVRTTETAFHRLVREHGSRPGIDHAILVDPSKPEPRSKRPSESWLTVQIHGLRNDTEPRGSRVQTVQPTRIRLREQPAFHRSAQSIIQAFIALEDALNRDPPLTTPGISVRADDGRLPQR